MVIFVKNNSKNHTQNSIEWREETEIQDFVVENAETIFSEFLDVNGKICAIGKELHNGNGYADFIFLDQNGSLYIVETKLDSNTDKRRVFAQVTGYMGGIRNQCVYQTFEGFISDCEQSIQKQFGFSGTFDEYVQEKFKIDKKSVNEMKSNLKNNIKENSVFCIIIMDKIENSLKLDIDHYLMNNIQMCGVELQKYSESDTSFVTLHYYGIEKLFLNEKHTSKWYQEHVKGWNFFNDKILASEKLDENTKTKILKLTAALENISNSEGWVKKSNNKLETFFKKFGDYDYYVLNIYDDGTLNFHLTSTFKDDPNLGQDFKNQFSKIDPIIEQEIKGRTFYSVKPELWVPKVDEFISLFEEFYA